MTESATKPALDFAFEPFRITAQEPEPITGQNMKTIFPCCGLEVTHAWRGSETDEAMTTGRELLKYWANHWYGVHRCDLVTPENPFGRIDKAP